MKKGQTYIAAEKFTALVAARNGFEVKQNTGFVKVEKGGRRLYIGKTKRVGRIDVSGWVSSEPGLINLGEQSFGQVQQQFDFTRTEDQILATFEALLDEMETSAPVPAKARESAAALWATVVSPPALLLNDE